jgi:pyruvate ferredoxin oxidoreductase delta subunit
MLIHADHDICAGAFHAVRPVICYEKCEHCGTCAHFCTKGCIRLNSHNEYAIDLDRCIGCARCVEVCPNGCISMVEIQGIFMHC